MIQKPELGSVFEKRRELLMNRKIIRKIQVITGLLALALMMVGPCVSANAASAKLNKKTATVTVGKTVKLKIKNTGSKVKWTSSNKKVATVKKSGKYGAVVTGKKTGKATITAKVGSKKLKCKVTVKKKSSSTSNGSIALNKTYLSVKNGKSATLKVTGTTKSITSVSSSKSSVATVKKTGARTVKITGKKNGVSTIKVKIAGKILRCLVAVSNDLTNAEVEKKNKKVADKLSVTIQTSLTYKDVEQECRDNSNFPADIKTFDTATITITNNHNKSVKIVAASLDKYVWFGKSCEYGKISYGYSVRENNEEWPLYWFYAPTMRSEWMKTITVKPGETKSITYRIHKDISEYSQSYIEYVESKYGKGYLENKYSFSGITDKTNIEIQITDYPFETSNSYSKDSPGRVYYNYYPATNQLVTDWGV